MAAGETAERTRTAGAASLRDAADVDRREWDELADRTGAPPFTRPGWIDPYWDAFAKGRPVALVVRRGNRLAGLLPLEARRGALMSATNWQTPLFGPLAEDDDVADELANGLIRHARRRADLSFLDRSARGLAQTRSAAREAGLRVIERTITRAPYVPVTGSFDEFMAGLERKFRKEIGRHRRRLEERGEVEFAYEDGSERLGALLDDGFRLEGSGWKTAAGTAIVQDPVVERFYREVCGWAAERGWLALAFLRLDGSPIAFDLCLEVGAVSYVLKGGFDVEERKIGPGVLLTHDEIRRAFESGFASYELLGQADEYKLRWTSAVHDRIRLQVFPSSPAGAVEHLAWRRGRPAVKRLQDRVAAARDRGA